MIVECKLKLPEHYDQNGVFNGLQFTDGIAVVREDQPGMAKIVNYYRKCYAVEVIGEEGILAQPEIVVDGPAPLQTDEQRDESGDVHVPAEEDEPDSDDADDDEPADEDSEYPTAD